MTLPVPSSEHQVPGDTKCQVWDPQFFATSFDSKNHARAARLERSIRTRPHDQDDKGDRDRIAHDMCLSNSDLMHLVLDASQSINWSAIVNLPVPPEAWVEMDKTKNRRTSAESTSTARIHTQQNHKNHTNPALVAVMAHTIAPCSLRELMLVLESTRSDQFCDVMQVVHNNPIKSAELVHQYTSSTASSRNDTNLPSSGLLIKVLALEKKPRSSRLFRSRRRDHTEWSYLDFVERVSTKVVRKTIVSLPLTTTRLLGGKEVEASGSHDQQPSHQLLAGYLFEELEDGKSTRISFWGEHLYDQSDGALNRLITDRAANSRMLRLAESVDRFMLVVRRRRLGVQVMMDQIKVQSSNSACACCNRSFLLTRKKVCNLCGYYVCVKCSQLEDRERKTGHGSKSSVSCVCICRKCIIRVDQCSYTTTVSLKDGSLSQIDVDLIALSTSSSCGMEDSAKRFG